MKFLIVEPSPLPNCQANFYVKSVFLSIRIIRFQNLGLIILQKWGFFPFHNLLLGVLYLTIVNNVDNALTQYTIWILEIYDCISFFYIKKYFNPTSSFIDCLPAAVFREFP